MKEALLVIDAQNVYFAGPLRVTFPEGHFENILKAVDHATSAGIPIVVVQHTSAALDNKGFARGSKSWKLHPGIESRHRNALIEKTLPGSFTGTVLEGWLKSNGIERIVISGYMTQMCCDTTARQAFHLGYQVVFLSDATGTLTIRNQAGLIEDRDLHRAVLVTQAMRFSQVVGTAEWISSLTARGGEGSRRIDSAAGHSARGFNGD